MTILDFADRLANELISNFFENGGSDTKLKELSPLISPQRRSTRLMKPEKPI
jgi:hypothetical protein